MKRFFPAAFSTTLLSFLLPLLAFAQPTADFSANITQGCSPIVVQFSDLSAGNPTSWNWNLGNGATSTLQNPSTTYINPGTYTVTLTASNAGGTDTKTVSGYITVLPAPAVQFTVSDSSVGCPPRTVSFTNLSVPGVGGASTYSWDFGDGTTSSAVNPTHTYTQTGNFTVSLVVTNSSGCTKVLSKQNYIQMTAKPTALFTATNNGSCFAPLTTSFINNSQGAVSYVWDFGDGGSSTVANPSYTYTTPGTYTVRLIATNAAGCKDTLTVPSLVSIGNLDAAFTQNVTTTCVGTQVTFTNTSTPGPGTSTWFFGDGTQATGTNASHAYTTPGTYTVKLKVSYSNCLDSFTSTVTVQPKPTAAFTGAPLFSCTAPLTTTFSNTSTGATSYLWLFGDGTTSTAATPSKTYNSNGIYTVKLVAIGANGCADTFTRPNYVVIGTPGGVVTASPNGGCAPKTINFTAQPGTNIPVASYSWSFGGSGQTASHTFTTPGTYTVVCTITLATTPACTYTAQTTVNIGTMPTAAFTGSPTTVCVGQPVSFTNNSTGATTYTWLANNGVISTAANPTTVFNQPGTYTVSLIASNNTCSDTETVTNMIVVNEPSADFAYAKFCNARKTLQLFNLSSGGHIFNWTFGDGASSTQVAPTHTYTNFGTYTVTLTATDTITGCTSVKSFPYIFFDLDAQFNADDTVICRGESVAFTAQTAQYWMDFNWSFGDGTTASGASVNHQYATPGLYTVRLIVTDIAGCKDTLIRPAYIRVDGPVVAFGGTPVTGCQPLTVNFTDSSTTIGGNPITSRKWYFGDGQTLVTTGVTNAHIYPVGTYNVTLVATDSAGCKDSLVKPAYISVTKPTAGFFLPDTTLCVGMPATFVNLSTGSNGYNWDFGDGTTSIAPTPTKSWGVPGIYTVRLIVTNGLGCADTSIRTAYVHVTALSPSFTASDTFAACPPLTVQFTNTTAGTAISQWTLGNGSYSSQQNPSAVYAFPGTYTVKLKVTSAGGCVDSVTKTIVILGPSGSFTYTPQTGCAPISITFTGTAQNTTSYTWDMNNGQTTTTTSPTYTHSFTTPGFYVPIMVLSNGAGCNVAYQGGDTIKVSRATAGFIASTSSLCNAGTVNFTDTSSSSVGTTIVTRSWNFGNGQTSTAQNPSVYYSTPGTYTVTQVVTNNMGCSETATHTITVLPKPNTVVSGAGAVCKWSTLPLSATGAQTYSWTPATGLSCTGCANPTATVTGTQTYTLISTGANGCHDTDLVTVTMHPEPNVSVATPAPICSGPATAVLTATGATTYVWSPAQDLSATTGTTVSASPDTTTTYTIIGTNAQGCHDTAQVTVIVNPTPVLVTNGPVQNVCNGASVQLTASGAANYVWTPGTDLSCTTCATPTATPLTTTTYTVTGTTGVCSASAQITVNVTSTPSVSAGPDQNICVGGSATLQAGGATTYVWNPTTGFSGATGGSITVTPTVTTTYTVTGTAPGGCLGEDTVTVVIVAPPTVDAGAAQTICAGQSATLTATGATTYSWNPSGSSTSSVTVSPGTTTTYTVTGTTFAGCTNTDTVSVTVAPLPVLTVSAPQSICPGGSVSLTAGGADTIVWSPSTGLSCTTCANPTATPSSTMVYTVSGTSAQGCVGTPVTTTITVNPLPTITAAAAGTTICEGASTTLTGGGGASYVWSPSTGLSSTTGTTVTASPAQTTTYTVTGTDVNGCENTAQITVNVTPLPTVSVLAPQPICAGASAALQALGATAYSWTPAATLSNAGIANPTATPATTTTYVVTGTAQGCSDTAHVTVVVNPLPNVTAAGTASVCPGLSATLTSSGANTFAWSPSASLSSATGNSVVATPAATTTYVVTGTDSNGCVDTASVTITVFPAAAISAGPDAGVCNGQPASLQASGGVSYVWSPATALSCTTCANPQATPTTSTTYTVTGTDANGCVGTDTVVVNIGQLPTVSAGVDTAFCAGTSVGLQASGATTYVWSPATGLNNANIGNPVASGAATTTYVVTGTNAQGCSATDTIEVTVKTLPNVDAGNPDAVCPGFSSNLQASGAVSYQWTPAATLSNATIANPVATPASTTTYTVTGTGTNGCTANDTVTITVYPAAQISAGIDMATCAGTAVTLGASGAATYVWTPSAGLSNATVFNPTANPTATTTYAVTGTTVNGCVGTDTMVLTINALPVVNAGPDAAVCAGLSTSLQASGAIGYSWFPATGLNNAAIAAPTASPATTTVYTVTGTNAAGCVGTDQVEVTVRALPLVSAGPDKAYCIGGSATLQAGGASTYNWGPATALSCTGCSGPVANPATTTTYTVTGTDAFGCVNTDAVTVTVNPLPVVNAGADVAICEKTSTTLTATGAVSYVWTPGASLSCATCASTNATPATATTYTVTGTDGNGCVNRDSVRVSIVPHVQTWVGPGDSVCRGESVVLTAGGGVSYEWHPSTGLNNTSGVSVTAAPQQTTTYTVRIQENQCYWDTAQITVGIHPVPTVNAGADQSVLSGGEARIFATSTDATIWKWTPSDGLSCDDCLTPIAAPRRTQTYTIEASNVWGCSATDEVTVFVSCDLSQLFIPNTFTPNGDGENDRFYPRGKGIGTVKRFRVYNRWGELVYELANAPVNDRNGGWDGMHRGIPVKPDVYVWMIDAECESGDALQLKGDISLLR